MSCDEWHHHHQLPGRGTELEKIIVTSKREVQGNVSVKEETLFQSKVGVPLRSFFSKMDDLRLAEDINCFNLRNRKMHIAN